jgi:hypothetical protein
MAHATAWLRARLAQVTGVNRLVVVGDTTYRYEPVETVGAKGFRDSRGIEWSTERVVGVVVYVGRKRQWAPSASR